MHRSVATITLLPMSSLAGNWQLAVSDRAAFDAGTLNGWEIVIR